MSDELFSQDRMEMLLSKLCDGRTSEDEFSELDTQLRESEEARAYYHGYMNLHATLHTYLGAMRVGEEGAAIAEPSSSARRKVVPIRPHPRPRVNRVALAAAAVVILGVGLGLTNWMLQWNGAIAPGDGVAEVDEREGARWAEDSTKPRGGRVRAGQRLHLATGMAAVELARGARIAIDADTDIEVVSDNSVRLHSGRLMATVPESAQGFLVMADSCDVIDLGTAFAMEIRESGAVDVSVFEGTVEVAVRDQETGEMVSIQPMRVGQTRRIREGEMPEKIPFKGRKRFGDLREMQDGPGKGNL